MARLGRSQPFKPLVLPAARAAAAATNASIAFTDAPDLVNVQVTVTTGAPLGLVDAPDIVNIQAVPWVTAQIVLTDAPDLVDIQAGAGTQTSAQIAVTDAPDIVDVQVRVTTAATFALTDAPDLINVQAVPWVTAQLAVTDAPDVMAITGVPTVGAALALTDAPDLVDIQATVPGGAAIAVTDAPDIMAITTSVTTGAAIALTDAPDVVAITTSATTGAAIAWTEAPDRFSISTNIIGPKFDIVVLEDGPRNTVIVCDGALNGGNLSSTLVVDLATLYIDPLGNTVGMYRVDRIDYSIQDPIIVMLYWGGALTKICNLAGRGHFFLDEEYAGISTVEAAGVRNGKIYATTSGYASGAYSFSLVLKLVKQELVVA
jgi:hypothetical protein